jgi:hypothetical protein
MELVTLPAPSAHDLGIRAGNGHPLRMRTAGEALSELTAGELRQWRVRRSRLRALAAEIRWYPGRSATVA